MSKKRKHWDNSHPKGNIASDISPAFSRYTQTMMKKNNNNWGGGGGGGSHKMHVALVEVR